MTFSYETSNKFTDWQDFEKVDGLGLELSQYLLQKGRHMLNNFNTLSKFRHID